MSFTRVAGSTHETRICNHLVPEESLLALLLWLYRMSSARAWKSQA